MKAVRSNVMFQPLTMLSVYFSHVRCKNVNSIASNRSGELFFFYDRTAGRRVKLLHLPMVPSAIRNTLHI